VEFLKQELTKAGATALDANQESAIHSAITSSRNANRRAAPDAAEKSATDNHDTAMAAGTKDSAKTAADHPARWIALRQQARLGAEAALSIQVPPILRSDQISALQKVQGRKFCRTWRLPWLDQAAGPAVVP